MNIGEAKEQIKNAITAYFTKDAYGNYCVPVERQRPIFLMGPPGIGKTAIMEQIAQEMGVCLVSYSMTHHTRQSALGLPFIQKKVYGGREYSVSEYTMSEIIASVYDAMEETGRREGILFLDEINCVSETLAPVMLQFLQYKVFGRHRVSEGWIVVTAGNPPQYNNSVREFDIVTWDRLKRIDVEPDYEVWKKYAYRRGTHAAVITYLDIKRANFYSIETTVDGKSFVTARGWSDLSDMMQLYERNGIAVDEKLIGQYLQNRNIAKDFAIYYNLYDKYKSDYHVADILAGRASEEIKSRARGARFDERLALLGLLLDNVAERFRGVYLDELALFKLMTSLQALKKEFSRPGSKYGPLTGKLAEKQREQLERDRCASLLSPEDEQAGRRTVAALEELRERLEERNPPDGASALKILRDDFNRRQKDAKEPAAEAEKALANLFRFCEEVFPDGQELLILVTELTINFYSAQFISRHGSPEYFAHNKELLFYERQKEIIRQLDVLDLDDWEEGNGDAL